MAISEVGLALVLPGRSRTWILTVVLWIGMGIPVDSATPANPKIIHVLNRLSLGIRPGDNQEPRRKRTGYRSRFAPEPQIRIASPRASPQSSGEYVPYSIQNVVFSTDRNTKICVYPVLLFWAVSPIVFLICKLFAICQVCRIVVSNSQYENGSHLTG